MEDSTTEGELQAVHEAVAELLTFDSDNDKD